MTVFGRVIDAADVEQQVIAHLQAWMPTTIAEVVRQKDPGKTTWPQGVAPIREYAVSHADAEAEKWPEDQLPMVIVQSPGEEGSPFTNEEGKLIALYGLIVTVITSSVTEADTKALARVYGTAARMAIGQEQALKAGTDTPFASAVKLGGERNGRVRRGVEAERNLFAVSHPLVVEVDDVMDLTGGPLVPQTPEELEEGVIPPEWPHVKKGGGSATVDMLGAGGFFDEP